MSEHNGSNDPNNNDNNSNEENNQTPPPPYSDSFVDFLSLPPFASEESLDAYLQTYFPEVYAQDEQLPPYEEAEEVPPQIQEEVPIHNPPQAPSHTLPEILAHLRSAVHPYCNVSSGIVHPEYPRTVLDLHLLTEPRLDRLFVHYDQVWPPTFETHLYPISIPTWLVSGPQAGNVHVKRYWFGQFIGLGHVVDRVAQTAGPELEAVLLRVQLMLGGGAVDGDDGVDAMERKW